MKKLLTLLLSVITAVAFCFGATACKKNGNNSSAGNALEIPAFDASVPNVTVSSDFKVGFIFLHDEKSTYDLNFMNAAKAACAYYGLKDSQIIYKTNIAETSDCYTAAEDLVSQGCKAIFADSFGHENYLMQSAKNHANVQYFHATGTSSNVNEGSRKSLPNVHTAFANIYEGRYLAGYAAGLKLAELIKKGDKKIPATGDITIGYVGAFTYAEVISGYTSWYLGVKQGCVDGGKAQDAERIKMKVTFTGSWYDVALEKTAAENLISEGCVMISQHADSMGAPSACEKAGVYNVFYNGTTLEECPNTFIIASRINWTHYMKVMIGSVASGKAVAKDYCATIEDGAVVVTNANAKLISADIANKVLEMRNKIVNKEVFVFDCSKFTVKNEKATDTYNTLTLDEAGHLTSYKADCIDVKNAEGKSDYAADTEVVRTENGITYVSESTVRSAPYFNIKAIDGITLLDTQF